MVISLSVINQITDSIIIKEFSNMSYKNYDPEWKYFECSLCKHEDDKKDNDQKKFDDTRYEWPWDIKKPDSEYFCCKYDEKFFNQKTIEQSKKPEEKRPDYPCDYKFKLGYTVS